MKEEEIRTQTRTEKRPCEALEGKVPGVGGDERGKLISYDEKHRIIPRNKLTDVLIPWAALVISVVGWREGKIELALITFPSSTPASHKRDDNW